MAENTSSQMSTGEKAGIALGAILVLGILYLALKPKKVVAVTTPMPADVKSAVDASGLGELAQYAIDDNDLLAASHLMALIQSVPGYDDGSGGGFAMWWLNDLPLYMPGGDRDVTNTGLWSNNFFGGNWKINGETPLTMRIGMASNELGESVPAWNQSGASSAAFNLMASYLGHDRLGLSGL